VAPMNTLSETKAERGAPGQSSGDPVPREETMGKKAVKPGRSLGRGATGLFDEKILKQDFLSKEGGGGKGIRRETEAVQRRSARDVLTVFLSGGDSAKKIEGFTKRKEDNVPASRSRPTLPFRKGERRRATKTAFTDTIIIR